MKKIIFIALLISVLLTVHNWKYTTTYLVEVQFLNWTETVYVTESNKDSVFKDKYLINRNIKDYTKYEVIAIVDKKTDTISNISLFITTFVLLLITVWAIIITFK